MRDVHGDTNFKGSDSSDPTVYSLYCATTITVKEMGSGKWEVHYFIRWTKMSLIAANQDNLKFIIA